MPIVDLQRQFRELGRLRLGHQVEFRKNGVTKRRPEKLGTWRLTSPRPDLLERAAEVYGGTVTEWPEGPDGDSYQIITATDELDMLVPPGRPFDQWNELWGGGGCLRRCDGRVEKLTGNACLCKRQFPDLSERTAAAGKGDACKPTTRLQVILPRLPDVGTWMLVSHSYYAAVELAGTVDLLLRAREAGRLIEARLWIDQRTVKRQGQPTKQFPVPAIRIPETFHELMAGTEPQRQIVAPNRPALPPGPELPADPSFTTPASPGLTREALLSRFEKAGVTPSIAFAVAERVIPGYDRTRELSPAERLRLWEALALEWVDEHEQQSIAPGQEPLFSPDEEEIIGHAVEQAGVSA